MRNQTKILALFSRYLIIIILGLANLKIINLILTPPTIQASYLILKIFSKATLSGDTIHLPTTTIQIAPACIAASAFFLLTALLLAIPNIKPKQRTKIILTAILALFILNIIRITALASLTTSPNFETIHFILWHIVSTILVVGIYIATIKTYKIKEIPIISDLKYLNSLRENFHKQKKL